MLASVIATNSYLIKFTNANTENSLHLIIQYKNGSL